MDSTKKHDNPSPEITSNFLSKIFFWWIFPFFKHGYKNNLHPSDIYNVLEKDKCEAIADTLQKHWQNELKLFESGKKDSPSLKVALFKTFVMSYSLPGLYIFIQVVIVKTLQPIVLAKFILYFNESTKPDIFGKYSGWILGTTTVTLTFIFIILQTHSQLGCQIVGMRIRVACSSLVYRKLLKLSQVSLIESPGGKLVNILSNDLQRFDDCLKFMHYIWAMPIQAVISFYLLYQSMGLAGLAGTIIMILVGIVMQVYISKLVGRFRLKIAERTDRRIKLMGELVSGIKVVKMYAWEKYFSKVVKYSRNEEVSMIAKTSNVRAVYQAFMVITERFALYFNVIVYVLLGNKLTAEAVFSCAQLYNSMQLYMCSFFPLALISYAETKISIRRIESFLLLEENTQLAKTEAFETYTVDIQKACATWDGPSGEDTLRDISLRLTPGALCCVVGSVGSGKSSLLQMILKELPIKCGTLKISGEVSYGAQEPWLFVSSIRDNILFGRPYIKERYEEVIRVCALKADLKQFPFGDRTLVEEKGVSLSGGQKARINLARAIYADADIYLLDDPLSAVDTRVGRHLFEKCIEGYLRDKTIILVTHQLQFLRNADVVVLLEKGSIQKIGTYSEVCEKLLNRSLVEHQTVPDELELELLHSLDLQAASLKAEEEKPQKELEVMGVGTIPSKTYVKYFRFGTTWLGFVIMVGLYIMAQLVSNAGDLWLTYWVDQMSKTNSIDAVYGIVGNLNVHGNYTNHNQTQVNEDSEVATSTLNMEMIIYSVFTILVLILTLASTINFYRIAMNSSRNIHNKMFGNVLEAPMRFFDTNPSGRILNRFSNDMGIIDEILPRCIQISCRTAFVTLGIFCLVLIKVPWMILVAIILGVIFWYLMIIFLRTAQDVKRLEGLNRAPVFSHLIGTLAGMTTIRAARCEYMITKEFETLLDQHTATWYLYLATCHIFGFYLDSINTIFTGIVTYQYLLMENFTSVSSANVGLVLSQTLMLTGLLSVGARFSTDVSNHMTSVERVLQYTKLGKETEDTMKSTAKTSNKIFKTIDRDWPSSGSVQFRHVYLTYSPEEPPVLKNLNFVIASGEKVGVVGRTGAGKSSLISALFRLSPVSGSIYIDGVDTASIQLSELRSNISIIPQEPVLFSASVRYNLDPFKTVTDDQIWDALESVEMKSVIENLDAEIREGGSNLSTGQKQLICLARAILRNNKLLVLDEATANVDPRTDVLIQKAIRNNFQNCTVITIAHRLNTIMDSDKVLVMDGGCAVEYEHPFVLLQDSEGYFSKLVRETDATTEHVLRNIAEDHYKSYKGPVNRLIRA